MIIQLLKNHCRNLLRYISSLLMENHLKINGSFKKEFFFYLQLSWVFLAA